MRKPPRSVTFNGKFIAQPLTGVQRFARELIVEADRLLAAGRWIAEVPFRLVVPAGHSDAVPCLARIEVCEVPATRLHAWEQWRLPAHDRSALIVNLAGSAPLLRRGQICTFHDAAIFDIPGAYSALFTAWYRLLFHVQGRLSRRVLTVSEFSRDRLSHHLGISSKKIGIVPNGASHIDRLKQDDSVLDRFGLEHGGYLLAVGSDNPSKNFAALMQAFRALKKRDTRLVVVGGTNGAVFSSAQSPSDEVDDPRVVRTGRLSDAQLKSLYTHARAFVFPSLYEGFGIPPLEAMGVGCAVVAADAASIPEVCGDAAGYFDPCNMASITAALERALVDDAWLEDLRCAGRTRALRFSWTAAAEALLSELATFGVVRATSAFQ